MINNNLWIGTYYGLNKFSPDESEKQFKRFFHLKDRTNSLSDNTIWAITKSIFEENTLLIGTANGITTLDTESELLKTISIPNPTNLMFGTGAGSIIEEIINGEKIFWTNSYAGLLRYNKTRNSFDRFLSDKYEINSLSSNQIINIYKDRSGVIWIVTDKGLNYFSSKNTQFNGAFLSSENSFEPGELGKMNIKALAKTSEGTLWFGTEQGLFYSSKSGTKKNIKEYSALKNYNIWTLAAGKENELWIGTYGSGLFLLNPKTNTLTPKPILDNIIKSSSRNFIKSLYLDSQNRLWVGYWGIGLARIDFNNGEVKHWQSKSNDENSLSYDDVWVIFEDSKSRIWIGTNGGGLNIYDNKNDSFFRFNTFNKSKIKLSSNGVYSIIQSGIKTSSNNESILWVGTNKGLNKITIDDSIAQNAQFPTIKRVGFYTVQNGLIDNSIKSIVEDNGGNLWLGTSSGISFYDVAKNTFTNYSSSEGVTGNDFNSSSSLKVSEDLILMGSTSGINLFNPNQIVQSNYIPPLVLTDFQIFNNSVEPDSNSVLSRSISSTKEITLSYTQSVFSFQYSAFDYNSPASINYSYMMQGFDKDWIAGGSRRFITYTNLNPGKYVFKVKSTNSDGVWYNNTTTVAITINPPWWQTVWAVLLYFVVFVTGIWGIIKFQVNRHRLQNELKIREFESYHLREIEQMKSRFFAKSFA